jgi:hypothetical protein
LGESYESYEIPEWDKGRILALSAADLRVVKWYMDASFAVHPDFKSHTGAVMVLGKERYNQLLGSRE